MQPDLDLILADSSLPQFDAPSVLRLLRERNLDIPVIIVSSSIGEEMAVAALHQGAADYLLKDRLGRLGPAVTQALERRRLTRERHQAELLRDGQGRILEMIATNAPLTATLTNLAELVESAAPGMICSILLLDEDGWHVRHGAAPSLPESYTRALDGIRIGPRVGSCGTAMYLGQPVIVTDILQDPLWDDYRALAAPLGLHACWSIPVAAASGKILGSLAMYYRVPRPPRPEEWRLLDIATHIAGIAIQRQQAEDSLRQAEQKYRSIFEHAREGIFQSTPEGRFLTANPALRGFTVTLRRLN